MSMLDDFRESFGAEALTPSPPRSSGTPLWYGLCVCGHLDRYHSETVGGSFRLAAPIDKQLTDGRRFTHVQQFDGCRGALVNRGVSTVLDEQDNSGDPVTRLETFLPTCPCTAFRHVVNVDRPGRSFNQRVTPDSTDPLRHPFAIGVKAMNTSLSRRKRATAFPDWPAEEFDRRFVWTARRCSIAKCDTVDGVWPVFVNRDGLSELRCAAHRP